MYGRARRSSSHALYARTLPDEFTTRGFLRRTRVSCLSVGDGFGASWVVWLYDVFVGARQKLSV